MTHRIALIPGDGIGIPVTEAALRVMEASGADIATESFPWSCDHYLQHGRMMPRTGSRPCAASTPSSWAPSAGRPRARCRVAARAAAAHPQGLRPIRQHPPAPPAARRRGSAEDPRFRHSLHPREHRRRIFRRWRPRPSGHPGRGRGRDLDLHPRGRRTHPALRLRTGAGTAGQAGLGHQVERAAPQHGILGRGHRRTGRRIPGRRCHPLPHRRNVRADGHGPESWTWWSPRTSSATS